MISVAFSVFDTGTERVDLVLERNPLVELRLTTFAELLDRAFELL